MRRLILAALTAMLLLALMCGRAKGGDAALDKVDISSLVEWAESSSDVDARQMIKKLAAGEFEMDIDAVAQDVKNLALGEVNKSLRYIALLCAPCLILAAVKVVYPKSGAVYTLGLVCSVAVTATLVAIFADCLKTSGEFMASIGALNESVYPILAALLALSGKPAASALFTPSAALVGSTLSVGIAKYSALFASCAATLAAAGQMSSSIKLDGLERLVKRTFNLCLGIAMTALTCLLATRGELAKGYDSSSIQTAKFTVGSLLPIVGGEVADSIDTLVTSASLVRNAVGITGLILLVSACIKPIITLALSTLVVRLSSAIVEPLGASAPQRAQERFADALDMLLAACVASGVLVMILIGASMTLFGG